MLDLRADVPPGAPLPTPRECEARVVAWGLRTCYGHLGIPGHRSLDGREQPDGDARRYVDLEVARAVEHVGIQWLRSVCLRLAEMAGCHDDVQRAIEDSVPAAIKASGAYGYHRHESHTPRAAVRTALDCGALSTAILREAGVLTIGRMSEDLGQVSGARYVDLARYLVERILTQVLEPVSEELCRQLVDPADVQAPREERHQTSWWQVTVHTVPELLRPIGKQIMDQRLAKITAEVRALKGQIWGTLYLLNGGPVNPGIEVQS